MNQNHENITTTPATVTAAMPTKQAGEAPTRRDPWWWVEHCVWTQAMLSRLASREPANQVWFSLLDKTYAPANLSRAYEKVRSRSRGSGSAGVDEQTLAHFAQHAEEELLRLHEQLRAGAYRPAPVRRAWIPKPGSTEKRPLGIPAVRDRIVQGTLRHVLEPIFETRFAEHSYGFRPGRGAKDALRRVDRLLKLESRMRSPQSRDARPVRREGPGSIPGSYPIQRAPGVPPGGGIVTSGLARLGNSVRRH